MLLKINRLYDSHTHFMATGQMALGLDLSILKKSDDIKSLKVQPHHFRGDWLVGFGWDENKWLPNHKPNKQILDQVFGATPVFFMRADGHTSWLNTAALERMGFANKNLSELPHPVGGLIHRGEDGFANGILSDSAHMMVYEKLPAFKAEQIKSFLLKACEIFNQAGFTHVRDMSCTVEQWNLMSSLEAHKDLTVALDANFTVEGIHDLQRALQDCLYAVKNQTPQLRAKGLKIFFDGALGSETAWLSQPYYGKVDKGYGLKTWDVADLETVLREAWAQKIEFSVHTIGDAAIEAVVQVARKVSAEGNVGKLNIEHAQVVRNETIQMMKPLHVRCHMQPCHWLSDQSWLKDKLGVLYPSAFPWEALRLAQIPISFGSDSPIEKPSLFNNLKALRESPQFGVKAFKGDAMMCHSHPDKTFFDSSTVFVDEVLQEINLNGRLIRF